MTEAPSMTETMPVAPSAAEGMSEVSTESEGTTGRRRWFSGLNRKWLAGILLFFIVLVAIIVRVIGTKFGFPLLVHPDEWAIVDAVIDMAKKNSFEPPWSLRPDHVEMKVDYLLFATYARFFKHMSVEGAFAQNPLPFYFIARLATAAFGVATVGLAYLIGKRTSIRLGLVMAAIFAIFPAFVMNAHYATPDVPLTFALMLMIYALMRYISNPRWPSLLWASFAVALGIAIKYPAAVGAVMIVIVVVAVAVRDRTWWRSFVHAMGAIGAVIGFLFVISPSLFTNFTNVREELTIQSAGDRLGHPDLGLIGNLKYYAGTYFDIAGIVMVLLGILGLVLVVRQRRLDRLPWFVGVLVWLSLAKLPLTWERWGLPMWITPLLLAAVAVVYLFDRFRSWRTVWIPWLVVAVIGVHMAASVAMIDTGLTARDTRYASLGFAHANGITSKNSIFEGYTPFLPGTSLLFFRQVKSIPGGYIFRTKQGAPAKYAILSSGMDQRVFADPTQLKEQAVYEWIHQHGELVARFAANSTPTRSWFEPVDIARNLGFVRNSLNGSLSGPTIEIYRLPQVSS